MPSPLRLRADIHLAATGRDAVILDLGSDTYFCLADVLEPGPGALLDRLSSAGLHALSEAGLLAAPCEGEADNRPDGRSADPPIPPAQRDLRHALDRPGLHVTPAELAAAAGALVDLWRLGPDPLTARLLTLARRPAPRPDPSAGAAEIIRAACVFSSLLPWLPFEGACLRRSALLVAFLRRRGLSAHWVFGVRTWPFRAHCWVQLDDICLNDDVERLRAYVPILVV